MKNVSYIKIDYIKFQLPIINLYFKTAYVQAFNLIVKYSKIE